jgi:hypothetical protein
MFDIMYKTDGIGLAAPQVGVNARLMVYNPEGSPDSGSESVLVNPRIVSKSRATCWMEEGCLSFPDIFADVLVCTCSLCYSAWPADDSAAYTSVPVLIVPLTHMRTTCSLRVHSCFSLQRSNCMIICLSACPAQGKNLCHIYAILKLLEFLTPVD